MLKFRLHEVSSFEKNTKTIEKLKSLGGKEFIIENIITIGETFTMSFEEDEIKDKAIEIYKEKTRGNTSTKRICIVGKNGVYIIEFIEEVDGEIKGQIHMEEYIKNIENSVDTKRVKC